MFVFFPQVNILSERTISIRSKVSKMVVVIILLFAICWGPIQIFILFQSFHPNYQPSYTTYKIKTWANCMSYANSSVNPIVYGFMGASFQKSFRKTFPLLFRRKVRDSSMASRTANAEIKFVAAEEGHNNNSVNWIWSSVKQRWLCHHGYRLKANLNIWKAKTVLNLNKCLSLWQKQKIFWVSLKHVKTAEKICFNKLRDGALWLTGLNRGRVMKLHTGQPMRG